MEKIDYNKIFYINYWYLFTKQLYINNETDKNVQNNHKLRKIITFILKTLFQYNSILAK